MLLSEYSIIFLVYIILSKENMICQDFSEEFIYIYIYWESMMSLNIEYDLNLIKIYIKIMTYKIMKLQMLIWYNIMKSFKI